ncbi:hypothetical protein O6P43_017116 [Quillaja saponaria]|uniref:Uncharacterized protein n=1 Tax=Quillaja saponaria TaxID=32244 RepID=A0AAD7PN08_QUISA|nr:hypothetical protein O6P43_017116 [Quillaja saponaria]
MERGPSPILPSLMVMGLGLFICWTTLLSILETLLPLFELATFSMILLLLLLLLLIHLLSLFPTIRMPCFAMIQPGSSYGGYHDADGFGFGFGTLLLVVLFLLLYNLV